MEIKVLKFGGSSLSDSQQFKKVRDIIKEDRARRYIIASAPGKRDQGDIKVTDLLNQSYSLSKEGKNITEIFEKIKARYNRIIEDLELDLSLKAEFHKIKEAILTENQADYIASRGEYLNAMILANYLGYSFIDAEKYIFFTENGEFHKEKTNRLLSKILKENHYAVIPGFYGSMPDGSIRTFSRGGSDITGSIVARAVDADLYENWTDVSGMLMADPRIVKDPKVIETISYKELRELSYMGASIMHEEAIFPVKEAGIAINIRNTNFPKDSGTLIVPNRDGKNTQDIITGVAGKKGFSTIHIEKDMMNKEVGFGKRVLEILEKYNISFEHIPTGIDTMSIVLETDRIREIKEEIKKDIKTITGADKVKIEDGLAMLAVVGRGMVEEKGTAMRVFTALAEASIDIKMIDQGSSQINIIVGIDEKDYDLAIETIYLKFVG